MVELARTLHRRLRNRTVMCADEIERAEVEAGHTGEGGDSPGIVHRTRGLDHDANGDRPLHARAQRLFTYRVQKALHIGNGVYFRQRQERNPRPGVSDQDIEFAAPRRVAEVVDTGADPAESVVRTG